MERFIRAFERLTGKLSERTRKDCERYGKFTGEKVNDAEKHGRGNARSR